MEDKVALTQSPISTQNEQPTTPPVVLEQEVAYANSNNNNNISNTDTATVVDDVVMGTTTTTRVDSALNPVAVVGSEQEGTKKRRGRPRKYDVNGNLLSSTTTTAASPTYSFGSTVKRSRGRPRGSGKLQFLASLGGYVAETAGGSFTPHVVTVNTGEDVVSRVLSFSQKGPRAACIISATGVVSSVIIRPPASSGGVLRYEGRFEILTLSGSYTYGGVGRKNGMLSVSLAKPDGRVFGGAVEGSMIAAGPIQLVMGSFKQNISREIKRRHSAGSSSAPNMSAGNADSARAPQKVPKMMEDEPSFPSPVSELMPTTNGQSDNVIPATTNGGPDNVTPANQNMHSASVNGIVSLDSQASQHITDQRTPAGVDASVPQI